MKLGVPGLWSLRFGVALVSFAAVCTEPFAKPKSDPAEPKPEVKAEEITFLRDGQPKSVVGRIVTEAADGGVLLQSNDGELWSIERAEIQHRDETDEFFKPLSSEAISEKLLSEMPAGFRSYTTPHYVIIYNTSRTYAQWTSSLLERLYKAFTNYWEGQGLEVHEPEFPLPVYLFATRQEYDQASREDLPNGTGNIIGFYSLRSNRVNMFDLTGMEALRANGSRGSIRDINLMLSQPAAVPLVATIVHEATHQIAFNCGSAATVRRYSAVVVRRNGRVLRSARSGEHAWMARDRPGQLPAAGNVSPESGQLARRNTGRNAARQPAVSRSAHGRRRVCRRVGAQLLSH